MLISYQQLKGYLDCGTEKRVVRWLTQNRVAWWRDANGKPCTTLHAINARLVGETTEEKDVL